jgi:hypothetical protein
MPSSFAALLDSQFNTPLPSPELNIIKTLKEQHPQSQHLSLLHNWESQFPLSAYLATLNITPSIVEAETHSLTQRHSHSDPGTESDRVSAEVIAGTLDFKYDGVNIRAFKARWINLYYPKNFHHLVFAGEDDSVGKKLMEAVYTWANELNDEIWVFQHGCWNKSKKLYKAVKTASWDDVVLDTKFKEGLQRDTKTFFASKDVYESLDITWKRGILLLGPPGNGKTESIKALLHETKGVSALYVKSFTTCDVSALC